MQLIQIHETDNVAVAVTALPAGEVLSVGERTIRTVTEIPAGHKVAILPIPAGAAVIKYGYPIGNASADIPAGAWVHTHNLKTALSGRVEYTYQPTQTAAPQAEPVSFAGFVRADGSVGVRNEIWILPTVGCVNGIAQALCTRAAALRRGSVDEIVAFPHSYGCSQLGEDQENTRRILADLIRHPNAGGVLVVGLGCENSSIEVLRPYIGDFDPQRVKFLNCQDSANELADGMRLLEELTAYAAEQARTLTTTEKLIVGLKCGGSDGLSGITANPLVGRFSDLLLARGGTTILTEVPEMFGAETLLMNRAANEQIFARTVALIDGFKQSFAQAGQPIYENPSPGNKAGGISTLEDKSLGCTQKSGSGAVCGVLDYGERVTAHGLHLLAAPGNDLVAATALAAAGAQMILFTTGRGTPFAAPVPTLKIASNSALAAKKSGWIDFNAGRIAEDCTADDLAGALFDRVLAVAGGTRVRSEHAGYHDMAILKKGVTL